MAHRAAGDITDAQLTWVLMAGSGYPMVASHDPMIIDAVPVLARETSRGAADFEYQMLYGIRDGEQRRLAEATCGAWANGWPTWHSSCGRWPNAATERDGNRVCAVGVECALRARKSRECRPARTLETADAH